jgi:hypothetical protein
MYVYDPLFWKKKSAPKLSPNYSLFNIPNLVYLYKDNSLHLIYLNSRNM